ncbi:unnamed protein product [Rotaria sordida]|uniref:Uncharacterized protein n=1 Tax=Rotaria sordida TaxID=392033 RepID=A0A819DK77_9BILA|nr:unnamed protein product [Rotaria sordida]
MDLENNKQENSLEYDRLQNNSINSQTIEFIVYKEKLKQLLSSKYSSNLIHLIICVHGLDDFLMSSSNHSTTFDDIDAMVKQLIDAMVKQLIDAMVKQLIEEIDIHIKRYGLKPQRISFIDKIQSSPTLKSHTNQSFGLFPNHFDSDLNNINYNKFNSSYLSTPTSHHSLPNVSLKQSNSSIPTTNSNLIESPIVQEEKKKKKIFLYKNLIDSTFSLEIFNPNINLPFQVKTQTQTNLENLIMKNIIPQGKSTISSINEQWKALPTKQKISIDADTFKDFLECKVYFTHETVSIDSEITLQVAIKNNFPLAIEFSELLTLYNLNEYDGLANVTNAEQFKFFFRRTTNINFLIFARKNDHVQRLLDIISVLLIYGMTMVKQFTI